MTPKRREEVAVHLYGCIRHALCRRGDENRSAAIFNSVGFLIVLDGALDRGNSRYRVKDLNKN